MNKGNFNKPANIFFLALFDGKMPELYNGVKTRDGRFGPAIVLPEIPGMKHGKNIVTLDKFNPAKVSTKGKVYNALFQLNGGTKKFSDPQTFATLVKPEEGETKVVIVADKRWDFEGKLAADISIKCERGTGNPNGSVAPGTMILNDGDSIKFTWEGKKHTISNFEGFVHMAIEKPAPVKKEVKVKPSAPEVVADNRVKIEDNVTVVGKIELPVKVEKPTAVKEVVETTPVVKAVKPVVTPKKVTVARPFNKGRGDNGNHFQPTSEVHTNVAATTGLGSFKGGDGLAALLTPPTKKKRTSSANTKTTASSKKKAVA